MSAFQQRYFGLLQEVMDNGQEVEVGQWQSQDVSDKPEMVSRELRHVRVHVDIPNSPEVLKDWIRPNLPWAEDHFQERIGGEPLNPPPSEAWWPHAQAGNADHKDDSTFSHTYPERMWPKMANVGEVRPNGRQVFVPHNGIRYEYGDLNNVIDLLVKNPLTRQAYLPIWFPEDTGAVDGQRVPCTLGYHFLVRNGLAEMVYHIRSCDLLRHFADDVYMACRLLQHVVGIMQGRGINVTASSLIMNISSLHVFRGDYPNITYQLKRWEDENEAVYGSGV